MASLQRAKNPDPFVSENFSLKHDGKTRLDFVRKVYGILSAQLLMTTVFVTLACLPTIDHHNASGMTHSPFLKGYHHMLKNPGLLSFVTVI